MIKYFLFIITIILNCQTVTAQASAQMKWMTGTWKINTGNGTMLEQWHISDDSTLKGRSMFIKNSSDSMLQESIELAFRNGKWHYIPAVITQNNAMPVSFTIILLKGTEFISENPQHDFPQRIAYRRIKNQLYASIEGRKNGYYGKQNFDFLLE